MTADHARRHCIDEAARLVAGHDGGAGRLRARHRRREDGSCTGCGPTPTPWPCVQIVIAARAERLRREGPPAARSR